MQRDLPPLGGAVGHQQQIANLGDLQRGPVDARLVDQRRGIEQAVKIEVAAGAQISAQLLGQLLLAFDPLAVTRGRELHHAFVSKRRAGVNGEQLPQLIEFEHALAGVMDWAGRAHQGCVYGTAASGCGSRPQRRARLRRGQASVKLSRGDGVRR